jgi:hypothetical protein
MGTHVSAPARVTRSLDLATGVDFWEYDRLAKSRRRLLPKGVNVASASEVTRWDLPNFDWVEIVDTDKVKYRYAKKGQAPAGATVHVDYGVRRERDKGVELGLRLVFVERMPVLRQDGPGLPEKIAVQYEQQGWVAVYEYEQVQPED